MVSLNVTPKRRNLDEREVEYYRNKAKDEEFVYTACKFWETTGYLDSSDLSTLYRTIKVTGHIEDFHLIKELEPGPVGNPVGNSATLSYPDGAIAGSGTISFPIEIDCLQPQIFRSVDHICLETYHSLPDVGPLPSSEQATIAPLNNHANLPAVANQSHIAANALWSDSLDLGGLDFQSLLSSHDLSTSICSQPAGGPRVSPKCQAGTAEQIVDPIYHTGQATDLVSTCSMNEPVDGTAHPVPLEPASSGIQTSDQGGLSYPTPSTSCNSPASGLREITPASPVTTPWKRANRAERVTDYKRNCRQKRSMSSATMPEGIIYSLLTSCVFGKRKRKEKNQDETHETQETIKEEVKLSDKHAREVLKAGARLLRSDPCETLRSSVQTWAANESRNLHALGIPIRWRGIEEAAEYFTKLHSNAITDPVSNRVAELRLFINYKDMCERPEDFCPRLRRKTERKATYVLNCIIEAIPHHFNDQQSHDSRRDSVSHFIRCGGWWWKLSHMLGIGLLLLGDEELFRTMKNEMFTNTQIDALITYASRVRPGTIRLLHLSNSVTRALILGKVSSNLVDAVQSDGSPLFARASLIRASDDDNASLTHQCPDAPWTNVVPEGEFPSDNFLAILSDNEMSNSQTASSTASMNCT